MAEPVTLRSRLRELYFGATPAALRFQGWLVVLDFLVIGFFIASQFLRAEPWFYAIDFAIAAFVALDLSAKLFALG
jgi:voltage-gated potassium channel